VSNAGKVAPARVDDSKPLRCPVGGEELWRAMVGDVTVDVCADHGTWFDRNELHRIWSQRIGDHRPAHDYGPAAEHATRAGGGGEPRRSDSAAYASKAVDVIDRLTGALVLPGGSIRSDLSRSSLLASPMAAQAKREDMPAGGMHVYLGLQELDGTRFGVALHFEGERLFGYSLSLVDARYGTSWDDYSEEKQLAQRDAHDAWLVASLGPGNREPSPRGPELRYSFPWGDAWSTFDARGGSSSIGVRFGKTTPNAEGSR